MSTWGLKSQLIKAFFMCISMGALFGGVRSTEWNKLPAAIRSCNTVESFKSALKTHLFDL